MMNKQIFITEAEKADDLEIIDFLSSIYIKANIEIKFNYKESFFKGTDYKALKSYHLLAKSYNGKILGLCSLQVLSVKISQKKTKIGYISNLRVSNHKSKLIFIKLFKAYLKHPIHDEVELFYSVLFAGNKKSNAYLRRFNKRYHKIHFLKEMKTFLLPTKTYKINNNDLYFSQFESQDYEISNFIIQHNRYFDFLNRTDQIADKASENIYYYCAYLNKQLVGLCVLTVPKFKAAEIKNISPLYKIIIGTLNLFTGLMKFSKFPLNGTLKQAFIVSYYAPNLNLKAKRDFSKYIKSSLKDKGVDFIFWGEGNSQLNGVERKEFSYSSKSYLCLYARTNKEIANLDNIKKVFIDFSKA